MKIRMRQIMHNDKLWWVAEKRHAFFFWKRFQYKTRDGIFHDKTTYNWLSAGKQYLGGEPVQSTLWMNRGQLEERLVEYYRAVHFMEEMLKQSENSVEQVDLSSLSAIKRLEGDGKN